MGGLVRASGAMLAALTIATGGLVLGAGTAAAEASSDYLAPTCTADHTAWNQIYGIDLLTGSLGGDCKGAWFESQVPVGNAELYYRGTDRAEVGQVINFNVRIQLVDPSLSDVVVTSITHHAPTGYEFLSVYGGTNSFEPPTSELLRPVVAVDPVAGDVTLTAPDGGWPIRKSTGKSGYIQLSLTYKVISVDGDSTSGIKFTGTDAPASGDWMATGDTRGLQNSVGSLGSLYEPLPSPIWTVLPGSSDGSSS
ncbi:hypothetical protein [Rhodococcus sp. NPDC059234]|uniref:hypothetical protein n=1 Tax=Rhodococcus sp. NPDC059234 TaxID=3346781 RepID=UPI00366E0D3E